MTVVAKLHAAVERTKENPALADGLVLEFLDGVDLLALIAALCPEHTACTHCETPLCDECGIGDDSRCEHGPRLCSSCVWTCDVCMTEAGLEDYEPASRRL